MRNIHFLLLLIGILHAAVPAFAGELIGTIPVKKVAVDKSKTAKRYPGLASTTANSSKQLSPAVIFLEGKGLANVPPPKKRAELKQQKLQFEPRVLAVQAGTTVRFPNVDSVFHNVFSYSSAKRFDLGRYAKGEFRDEVFATAGIVRVYCEIHSHMRGYIVVVPNSFFAVTDAEGMFTISNIPAGSHRLVLWREGAKVQHVPLTMSKSGQVKLSIDDAGPSGLRLDTIR
jgi:plastocyanin